MTTYGLLTEIRSPDRIEDPEPGVQRKSNLGAFGIAKIRGLVYALGLRDGG